MTQLPYELSRHEIERLPPSSVRTFLLEASQGENLMLLSRSSWNALLPEGLPAIIAQIDRWCDDTDTTPPIDFIVQLRDKLTALSATRGDRSKRPIPGHPVWCAIHAGYFCSCVYVPKGLGGQSDNPRGGAAAWEAK